MSLLTLHASPAATGKRVLREAHLLAKKVGSKDDVADDLFKFAGSCFHLRLAVFKFIEIDNLIHRWMAERVAAGKSTPIRPDQWSTAMGKALGVLAPAIEDSIKVWKKNHLDRMKKAFGLSLEQLVEAETAVKEFVEALKD